MFFSFWEPETETDCDLVQSGAKNTLQRIAKRWIEEFWSQVQGEVRDWEEGEHAKREGKATRAGGGKLAFWELGGEEVPRNIGGESNGIWEVKERAEG